MSGFRRFLKALTRPGSSLSLHAEERLARVPEHGREAVASAIENFARQNRRGSSAALVWAAGQHTGPTDADVTQRTESNGEHFWAVSRDGAIATAFWRRKEQPATPQALGVDKVFTKQFRAAVPVKKSPYGNTARTRQAARGARKMQDYLDNDPRCECGEGVMPDASGTLWCKGCEVPMHACECIKKAISPSGGGPTESPKCRRCGSEATMVVRAPVHQGGSKSYSCDDCAKPQAIAKGIADYLRKGSVDHSIEHGPAYGSAHFATSPKTGRSIHLISDKAKEPEAWGSAPHRTKIGRHWEGGSPRDFGDFSLHTPSGKTISSQHTRPQFGSVPGEHRYAVHKKVTPSSVGRMKRLAASPNMAQGGAQGIPSNHPAYKKGIADFIALIKGNQSGKTEHAGSKKGSGAYWGRKADAKAESNTARRAAGKKAISEQIEKSEAEPHEHFLYVERGDERRKLARTTGQSRRNVERTMLGAMRNMSPNAYIDDSDAYSENCPKCIKKGRDGWDAQDADRYAASIDDHYEDFPGDNERKYHQAQDRWRDKAQAALEGKRARAVAKNPAKAAYKERASQERYHRTNPSCAHGLSASLCHGPEHYGEEHEPMWRSANIRKSAPEEYLPCDKCGHKRMEHDFGAEKCEQCKCSTFKAVPTKRRCPSCKRVVATTDHLTGAVVYGLHTPPGGGYCPGSHEPVRLAKSYDGFDDDEPDHLEHADYCDNEDCGNPSHNESGTRHNAFHQEIRGRSPWLPGDHEHEDCEAKCRKCGASRVNHDEFGAHMTEKSGRKPDAAAGEGIGDYVERLDRWKNQGDWKPANGGTETPFKARSGKRMLYVHQSRSGKHAYLDMDSDIVMSDKEAEMHMSPKKFEKSMCEDYPACGHGPEPYGDSGGCPDAQGRFNCVSCGSKLPRRASSSICKPCRNAPRDELGMTDQDRYDDEWRRSMNKSGNRVANHIAMVRGKIAEGGIGGALGTPEKVKAFESKQSITPQEHFAYQSTQSRHHAMGTITMDEANTVYQALGEAHNPGNGGWKNGTDLATKVGVTNLMGQLMLKKSAREAMSHTASEKAEFAQAAIDYHSPRTKRGVKCTGCGKPGGIVLIPRKGEARTQLICPECFHNRSGVQKSVTAGTRPFARRAVTKTDEKTARAKAPRYGMRKSCGDCGTSPATVADDLCVKCARQASDNYVPDPRPRLIASLTQPMRKGLFLAVTPAPKPLKKSLDHWPRCPGCGNTTDMLGMLDHKNPVCMKCVRARARTAGTGRCKCGRLANPGKPVDNGHRQWVPCRRCLGNYQHLPDVCMKCGSRAHDRSQHLDPPN